MKGRPLSFGIFLLILGLIIYNSGLLLALHQSSIINYVLNVIPDIKLTELIGMLLQLLGGIIAITGFTTFISGIITMQIGREIHILRHEISSRIEERISNLIAHQRISINPQAFQTVKKCKFCGTALNDADVFCPTCGKSQK